MSEYDHAGDYDSEANALRLTTDDEHLGLTIHIERQTCEPGSPGDDAPSSHGREKRVGLFSEPNLYIIVEWEGDEMTNNQAIGYAILAMKDMGIEKDVILQAVAQMEWQMDVRTEEEAESRSERYLRCGA